MKTLKITFIIVFLVGFYSCSITKNKNYIKIVGVADYSKAGAVVITNENQRAYFLDGMDPWVGDIVGKKLVVTGLLQKVDMDSLYKDQPLMQRVFGIKYTILRPKWKYARDDD
ncbi:hypothetical protein AAON49_00675 [Pseudotenacibaculum sp. MALMAid0570]|uniref:hypothetical protein n=1 Tax=Pseudotenacibaculum sp. MALMAid0570 TaxID=3143938 RepID=UPI0032DE8BB9